MKRIPLTGLVAIAVVLSFASDRAFAWPIGAGSWRCGARIVGEGLTTGDVYERCGGPTDRAVTTDFVTVRVARDVAVTRAVVIERWVYDRGPRQFVRYLTFEDGVLVAIDEGSYGAPR